MSVYLNDFIGLQKYKSMLLINIFLKLMWKLGLYISQEKSSLELEQEKEYLDLLIRTVNQPIFHISNKQKVEVAKEISRML